MKNQLLLATAIVVSCLNAAEARPAKSTSTLTLESAEANVGSICGEYGWLDEGETIWLACKPSQLNSLINKWKASLVSNPDKAPNIYYVTAKLSGYGEEPNPASIDEAEQSIKTSEAVYLLKFSKASNSLLETEYYTEFQAIQNSGVGTYTSVIKANCKKAEEYSGKSWCLINNQAISTSLSSGESTFNSLYSRGSDLDKLSMAVVIPLSSGYLSSAEISTIKIDNDKHEFHWSSYDLDENTGDMVEVDTSSAG